jgi:hypothetical protein
MLDIMYYVTHYSDALHHPKEDLVFARIKMRDASVGHTVDALTDQHARLRDEGETLVRALDDIVNGSILSRESVESIARAYISEFRAHMRVEETEMLPARRAVADRRRLGRYRRGDRLLRRSPVRPPCGRALPLAPGSDQPPGAVDDNPRALISTAFVETRETR